MTKSAVPESGTDTCEPRTPPSRETANDLTATTTTMTIGTQARPKSLVNALPLSGPTNAYGFEDKQFGFQIPCWSAATRCARDCGEVVTSLSPTASSKGQWPLIQGYLHTLRAEEPEEAREEHSARINGC
jgi:hypothetical protein